MFGHDSTAPYPEELRVFGMPLAGAIYQHANAHAANASPLLTVCPLFC